MVIESQGTRTFSTVYRFQQHRMVRCLVNKELERTWDRAAEAHFKLLPLPIPGGTEEDHEHIQ
jgi:hypothetical protein